MNPDNRQDLTRRAHALVAGVTGSISRSPGNRAALRRSVGRLPESIWARQTIAIVAPHLPESADRATERAFYAVAGLIAAQPRQAPDTEDDRGLDSPDPAPSPSSSTGTDLAVDLAATASTDTPDTAPDNSNGVDGGDNGTRYPKSLSLGVTLARAVAAEHSTLKHDTIEARLHLLCRQRTDGMHRQLPGLLNRLRTTRIPIDWPRLVVDLSRWDRERDRVAKQWLQDYYRTLEMIKAAKKRGEANDNKDAS